MSAEAMHCRSWRVGRYTVTLSVARPTPGAVMVAAVEWNPHLPKRLSERELQQYQRGRNAAVAELARELNLRVAGVDL